MGLEWGWSTVRGDSGESQGFEQPLETEEQAITERKERTPRRAVTPHEHALYHQVACISGGLITPTAALIRKERWQRPQRADALNPDKFQQRGQCKVQLPLCQAIHAVCSVGHALVNGGTKSAALSWSENVVGLQHKVTRRPLQDRGQLGGGSATGMQFLYEIACRSNGWWRIADDDAVQKWRHLCRLGSKVFRQACCRSGLVNPWPAGCVGRAR